MAQNRNIGLEILSGIQEIKADKKADKKDGKQLKRTEYPFQSKPTLQKGSSDSLEGQKSLESKKSLGGQNPQE